MTQATQSRPVSVPEIVELPGQPAAVVHVEGSVADMPRMLGEAFELSEKAIAASEAAIVGPPFARYLGFGDRVIAEVGFPFAGSLVPTERVYRTELPGGRTLKTTHVGPYDQIAAAWERTGAWMKEHQLQGTTAPWEAYLTGPDEPGPPITDIFFPIR